MGKANKLLERLKSEPKDFTWDEAIRVMKSCGFELHSGSGSRRRFYNEEKNLVVAIHEPHPQKILKTYQVKKLISALGEAGYLR